MSDLSKCITPQQQKDLMNLKLNSDDLSKILSCMNDELNNVSCDQLAKILNDALVSGDLKYTDILAALEKPLQLLNDNKNNVKMSLNYVSKLVDKMNCAIDALNNYGKAQKSDQVIEKIPIDDIKAAFKNALDCNSVSMNVVIGMGVAIGVLVILLIIVLFMKNRKPKFNF
uniref:Uncharacterized protein n=1 Tax=viral metagenome TaxID=1070528 RepID=A0A6C0CXW9_9ZZZZ